MKVNGYAEITQASYFLIDSVLTFPTSQSIAQDSRPNSILGDTDEQSARIGMNLSPSTPMPLARRTRTLEPCWGLSVLSCACLSNPINPTDLVLSREKFNEMTPTG